MSARFSRPIGVRLTPQLRRRAEKVARGRGVTCSDVLRESLIEFLKRPESLALLKEGP